MCVSNTEFFVLFTVFIPLYELITGLSEDKRARWERLWMVSDRRGGRLHPLIYSHPVTGYKVTAVYGWVKFTVNC